MIIQVALVLFGIIIPIVITVLAASEIDPPMQRVIFIYALAVGLGSSPLGVKFFPAPNLVKREVYSVSKQVIAFVVEDAARPRQSLRMNIRKLLGVSRLTISERSSQSLRRASLFPVLLLIRSDYHETLFFSLFFRLCHSFLFTCL